MLAATMSRASWHPYFTPLYTREASREADARLISDGIPSAILMENAGRGAAELIHQWMQDRALSSALLLVGPGNNGGDALVIARHLLTKGHSIAVEYLGDPQDFKGDAATMRIAWDAAQQQRTRSNENALRTFGEQTEVVIDGLFGTGLTRPLAGRALELVQKANRRPKPTLSIALDLPSGLDANTGAALGNSDGVFRATHTVTFGNGKPGLFTGFGRDCCGHIEVVGLGTPLPETIPTMPLSIGAPALPPRMGSTHKGDHGRVLIVGGAPGMTGAALLAARGAHRAGAGLVTIASRAAQALDAKVTETMTLALDDHCTQLVAAIERAHTVVLGPGLGRDEHAKKTLTLALAHTKRLVLDGDALTLLATVDRPNGPAEQQLLLTPHPLEMARLLGHTETSLVQNDRVQSAQRARDRYRANVVLKGAGTIIAPLEQYPSTIIVDASEPSLGVAGSGDVLAGAVGARWCETETTYGTNEGALFAMLEGVWAHLEAGRAARKSRGSSRGILASELADRLSEALESGTVLF